MRKKTEPRRDPAILEAREDAVTTGVVLDTHALIWLVTGNERLKPGPVATLEFAAVAEGLFVPAISLWEIGMLHAKGRISIPGGVNSWVRRVLTLPGLHLSPLSPEIALNAADLTGLHGDPADRMLVATAIHLGFPLATADTKILRWAAKNGLRTVDLD
jgi:PIN domain nuclease of toxin-antitoxin system